MAQGVGSVTVLAGAFEARAVPEASGVLVYWDQLEVPPGGHSVPAWLNAHLAELRQELLAFVYELGMARLPAGHVQERLKAGDSLSMWWCSLLFEKHPKVTPLLYPALKARALERMLGEYAPGCTAVELHGGDARLAGALRDFCAATGKGFCHVPSTAQAEKKSLQQRLRELYYALPGPAKAVLRFGHWLWCIRRHLPHTTAPRPQGKCGSIATYFPNVDAKSAELGRFRSRYWESLHDALAEEGQAEGRAPVNWLFVHFPSPQQSFGQCLALRDAFRKDGRDGASFHYLEEFLRTGDIWRALRRYVRLVVQSRSMEKDVRPLFRFAGSHMDLWGWLGEYWKDSFEGWRCLERCLQRRGMLGFVNWAGPQRWTIFPMENCPWERMLTEAVHTAGHGPVYGTQHSTVRPTDFRYFDDPRSFEDAEGVRYQPDRLCGNGQGACAGMLAAGTPSRRIGMVEALRYMYLADPLRKIREAQAALPRRYNRLLVVTSFFVDEVEAHVATLARWLREDAAAGAWTVVVKPHPYLAVEPCLARYKVPEGRVEIVSTPMGELLECAAQAEEATVVWASNSTTVALEAALMGLPVLVQMPRDDVDLCPLQGVEGVARVATAAEAARALARPCVAALPPDYLALEPALPRWRALLALHGT